MAAVRCHSLACACACHRAKVRQVPRTWTRRHDRVLTDALGRGETVETIADTLHVSHDAVRWRIKQLGLSTRDGWRSRQEVVAVLGVGRRAVDRWSRDGLLRVTAHGTRWTRVTDAELRAFVAAHAGVLFDPAGVTDASLRSLAETSAAVHRRRAG